MTELECIFEKKIECPVCDREFMNQTIRTGKIRQVGMDTDLRARYIGADANKYDVIACPHCGYAALTRFFGHLTPTQRKTLKTQVAASYKGVVYSSGTPYTYDEVIMRYKLALANAMTINAKLSEKADICLKLAWVYRGKAEELKEQGQLSEETEKQLKENEEHFLNAAYDGFTHAYTEEMLPFCGFDRPTLELLLADLARKRKEYDTAKKYISMIITTRGNSSRIKEKARDLREMIDKELENGVE